MLRTVNAHTLVDTQEDEQVQVCRFLWAAVIARAYEDALGHSVNADGANRIAYRRTISNYRRKYQRDARDYIFHHGGLFERHCEIVGVHPLVIREDVKAKIRGLSA